ncbi:MAG: hypothetical protein FWB98_06270 [Defluviitaleaceae bacterium]|nr:hypothetical protein [Defluviitaleaceae bacterium]
MTIIDTYHEILRLGRTFDMDMWKEVCSDYPKLLTGIGVGGLTMPIMQMYRGYCHVTIKD